MHWEVRRRGDIRKHYLAHSYREEGRVRKVRVYLGAGLSPAEVAKKRPWAEALLRERLAARAGIRDPLQTVLSPSEIRALWTLEARGVPRIRHLSDEDWQAFTRAFTYDTNAIEGSTVSAGEVREILDRNRWPAKPKEEISETYGVARAIDFIRRTREHVSLPLLLKLHRIVFENSKPFAGKFRPRGVEVVVADAFGRVLHRGAPAMQVKPLLRGLVAWYQRNKSRYPPLVLAAVVHNQFENIHPFQDGNGRVGRLLLNNLLLKHGLPPVNIELRNRSTYYAALQAYERNRDLRPTLELLLKEYRALKRVLKKR